MKIFWYQLKAIVQYILFSVVLMLGLYFLANYQFPLYIMLFFAAALGFSIGVYQVYFHFSNLKKRSFWIRLFIELVIVQIIIMIVVVVARPLVGATDLHEPNSGLFSVLFEERNTLFYMRVQLFSATLIFLVELERMLGRHFLIAFILGRYNRPKQEERVMLFIDIKNSTTIAEQLGDDVYYHFLNDCFERLGKATITTNAEILKYIGDEVVVSWRNRKKANAGLAIEFYRIYRNAIAKSADYFIKNYGIVPDFSAGLHQGLVTVAYIGDIKKQLDFSGDLMNTTARICDACKTQNAELLISNDIYKALDSRTMVSRIKSIGNVHLKGKAEDLKLYAVLSRDIHLV